MSIFDFTFSRARNVEPTDATTIARTFLYRCPVANVDSIMTHRFGQNVSRDDEMIVTKRCTSCQRSHVVTITPERIVRFI